MVAVLLPAQPLQESWETWLCRTLLRRGQSSVGWLLCWGLIAPSIFCLHPLHLEQWICCSWFLNAAQVLSPHVAARLAWPHPAFSCLAARRVPTGFVWHPSLLPEPWLMLFSLWLKAWLDSAQVGLQRDQELCWWGVE